jgi:hypothetical protein
MLKRKNWVTILIIATAWLVVSTYSYIESMLAINKYCNGVKAGVKVDSRGTHHILCGDSPSTKPPTDEVEL